MAKSELKEQLQSYESYINDIPLVIDPCKQCAVYKRKGGYDTGHFDSDGQWDDNNFCKTCCWYYDSKFEVALESENEKMSELLIAQANGKTIQTKMMNGEWRDVLITEQDLKCDVSFYRIKPEVGV